MRDTPIVRPVRSRRGRKAPTEPTPGPWRDLDLNWGHQILAEHPLFPGGLIVAVVNDDNPDVQTAALNARLIAAAPDLLAACLAVLPLIEHAYFVLSDGAVIDDVGQIVQNAIAKATDAIAKARGAAS